MKKFYFAFLALGISLAGTSSISTKCHHEFSNGISGVWNAFSKKKVICQCVYSQAAPGKFKWDNNKRTMVCKACGHVEQEHSRNQ